jgi:hypothetical protein
MNRSQIAILIAVVSLAGCQEDEPTEDVDAGAMAPQPDAAASDSSSPDGPPATSCEVTAIVNRVWEFSSSGSYFYLMLYPDGTYRRETDVDSSYAICEHGTWSVSGCEIDFDTCRGDGEHRAWSATATTFTLDQTAYRESLLNEATAFIFCDTDACTE